MKGREEQGEDGKRKIIDSNDKRKGTKNIVRKEGRKG